MRKANSKDIAKSFKVTTEPEFTLKYARNRKSSKKFWKNRKVNFFKKFENHCNRRWNVFQNDSRLAFS